MKSNVKYYIGTSGWTYQDWRGAFYPEDLPVKDWFNYYQTQFDVVELNATFYRRFSNKVYQKWDKQAKKGFLYIVKVPGYITHKKLLKDCIRPIKDFCKSVTRLKKHLGLILLQLPPRMPYDIERLKKALLAFDNPKKVVVEFRNKKWFTEETKTLLTQFGCIFCDADSPVISINEWLSCKTAYIRLHGHTDWYDYHYSQEELKNIVKIAKKLAKKGATKVFILFNNDYYAYAAENALSLRKLLKQ